MMSDPASLRRLAVEAGGQWLVTIDDREWLLIDGQPVTHDDEQELAHHILDYLLAEDSDPPHRVEHVRGKRVIHVYHRVTSQQAQADGTTEDG